MKGLRIVAFGVSVAWFGITPLNAQSTARLASRGGTVEVLRNTQWLQLMPGEAVNSGEKVRTGNDSSASIALGSGQVITLSAHAEIQLTDTNRRIYVANGQNLLAVASVICPNFYFSPYVMYGNTGVQMQPFTGYVPGQVIPPMTDPLRPPVQYPVNPFPVR
jgi:hypothetical protein